MLEQIGSMASIISFLTNVMNWTQRRFARGGIRVEAMLESGTVTREYGFTEKALKVTVMNESESEIKIRDIRLIFCGAYGASVAPEAPQGRSHSELPVSLDSGMEKDWYIPEEKLSELFRSLYHPQLSTQSEREMVTLHARCITGTGKVYKSSSFQFPTDPNAHGP